MNALFVHGICGSNFFFTPTLIRFRTQGIRPYIFGYSATLQDFQTIVGKLVKKMEKISEKGDYIIVGHSLGGVIVRAAINQLPKSVPKPKLAFLLGSPIGASRIAKRLGNNIIFSFMTKDCGQLLGSEERMKSIPAPDIPTIGIIGTFGIKGNLTPFGVEENDGVVTFGEVNAEWYSEIIRVPISHNLLTFSKRVSDLIIERIK